MYETLVKIPLASKEPHRIRSADATTLELSPFDVPGSATFGYDNEKKRFTIEFTYLTPEEPRTKIRALENVSIEMGRSSKKLYAIAVDGIDTLPGTTIKPLVDTLTTAIDSQIREYSSCSHPKDLAPYLNLSFVRDFIVSPDPELEALYLGAAG